MSGAAAVANTPAQEQPKADEGAKKETQVEQPKQEQAAAPEKKEAAPEKKDAPAEQQPKEAAPAKAEEKKPEGEPKKEGEPAKAADPAAKAEAPAAPEKYEIKVPEGSLLKPENVASIENFAKASKLSNAEAQAIVTYQHAEHAALETRRQSWLGELAADPHLGGENLKQNTELAHRVLNKYAPEDLKKVLNDTGLGNYPGLWRLLVNLGKAAGEDVLDRPGAQDGSQNLSPAQVLFGHHNNK